MQRTWGLDVLAFIRCQRRMELIAAIEEPAVVRRILSHLGQKARAPRQSQVWRPPWRPQASLPFARPGDAGEGAFPPAFAE